MTFKLPSFSVPIRRVMKNFAANAFGQLMNGVYQFVSIPLFLHYWSVQGYGEWLVLFSIPSLLWSLEGGLAGVALNRMTVASSAGNWDLVNALFQNVFLAQGVLTLGVLAGAGVLISTVDLQHYFHFKQISAADTTTVLLLLLCYMLSGFYITLFRSIYRAAELEDRGIMANNCFRFTDFLITVLVLVFHGHPLLLAKAMLGGSLAWVAVLFVDTRRICPRIEFGLARASWKQSKEIIIDGLPLLAGQAAMAFSLQGYPLVINRALGAASVVPFVTIRTISRSILLVNQVISLSSAPEVSRSYGRQDWAGYLRLLKIMLGSAMAAGLATLVGLSLLGPWVISLWTSGRVSVDHLTLFLFSISIALQGIYGVGSVVLVCSNMHHLYNYLCIVITLAALTLAYFVVPIFGFIAVPGTMLVQDMALTVLVVTLCKSKLGHISLKDLRSVFSSDFYWGKAQALFNRSEY
jgi:O-antigen/teichoic acid export membrane protein